MECHYNTSLASNFHGIGIQWLQRRVPINADSFLCRFPIHWIVKIHALDVPFCVSSVNETTNLQKQKHESKNRYKILNAFNLLNSPRRISVFFF